MNRQAEIKSKSKIKSKSGNNPVISVLRIF